MIHLIIAALAGVAFGAWAVYFSGFYVGAAVWLISATIVYFFLGRRTAAMVSDASARVEGHVSKGRVDRALAEIESLRPLARRQLFLGRFLDAQIGSLLFAHKGDRAAARPYLQRAPQRAWHARAMLAADHYQSGRKEEMQRTFDAALKRNRKESLLYAAYAWCEWRRGRKKRAAEILLAGLERQPKDARLQKNLTRLQNGKKMNLRAYGPAWWSLGLEGPKAAGRSGGSSRAGAAIRAGGR